MHQVGSGLRVSGRSEDGGVEALELSEARWCLGVQWHPELLPDDPQELQLFKEFAYACQVGSHSAG